MPAMGQAFIHTDMKSTSPPRICTPVSAGASNWPVGPVQPSHMPLHCELRDIFYSFICCFFLNQKKNNMSCKSHMKCKFNVHK